jgi:hypothetical protein
VVGELADPERNKAVLVAKLGMEVRLELLNLALMLVLS